MDFKSRFSAEKLIARHITAFANSQGGIILFGVGPNGELLGLEDEKYTLTRVNRLAASLLPASHYQIGSAELSGKIIAYVVVEEAPPSIKPVRLATGDALQMRDNAVVELSPTPVNTRPSRRVTVFVAMSFREEEEPALVDYFHSMRRAVDSTGLPIDLVRMDLVEGDYEISQKIMNVIDAAEIVLADFTLSPANVYFELGYARGKKRRIIQTAKKGTHLEFDARSWRTIFYRNATDLEAGLRPALQEAYADVTREQT